jgi:uncharacterized membrane protein
MEQLGVLIVAFAFYSFIGWCGEVIYNYLRERRWVNRGFLSGPFFLLYGVGVSVPVILCNVHSAFWTVVSISMLWAAVVEYGGSVILERIGLSYWDYSDKPFNFHGRICLESISTFVIGLVALVYVFHPIVVGYLVQIPPALVSLFTIVFVIYVLIDGSRRLQVQLTWYRHTGRMRNVIR